MQVVERLSTRLSRHEEIGRWCKADIDAARLRAAQRDNPDDFQAVVCRREGDERALHEYLPKLKSDGYLSVSHEDGTRTVWLFFRPGTTYNLSEEHRKALERKRVDITPHGRFWALREGDVFSAAKFLQHFGPLCLPSVFRTWSADEHGDEYAWQDLGDLWNKMHRFKAITTTWITLEDSAALKKSWLDLRSRLTEINQAGPLPFGSVSLAGEPEAIPVESELLARLEDSPNSFQQWLDRVSYKSLREETVSLIECELETQLGSVPVWRTKSLEDPDGTRPGFTFTLAPPSLWSALWLFFAQDTAASGGWRICPHCQKLFYPPRRDRFYCSSELQVEHSRRQWWNAHREEELAKRKALRRRATVEKVPGERRKVGSPKEKLAEKPRKAGVE